MAPPWEGRGAKGCTGQSMEPGMGLGSGMVPAGPELQHWGSPRQDWVQQLP